MRRHKRIVHEKIKIKCDQCEKLFSTNWHRQKHISRIHQNVKEDQRGFRKRKDKSQCYICDKEFEHEEMELHMLTWHSNEQNSFDMKDSTFANNHQVESQSTIEMKMEEDVIEEADPLKIEVVENPIKLEPKDPDPLAYQSEDASFISDNKDYVTTPYHCSICEKSYAKIKSLKRHEALTHKTQNFKCDICIKSFVHKDLLQQHKQKVHLQNKKEFLLCEVCKKSISKSNMKRHILEVHEKIRKYMCEMCDKAFTEKRNLLCHNQSFHSDTKIETEGIRCSYCSKIFNSKAIGRHTREVHEKLKPNKCYLCHKSFSRPIQLSIHVDTEHGAQESVNKFTCDVCSSEFKELSGLFHHLKNHKSESFLCNSCEKNFSTKEVYNRHIKAVHEKRKDFKCNLCDEEFLYRSSFSNHMVSTHGDVKLSNTRKKNWQCSFCNKSFVRQLDLEDHFLRIHQMTEENV